MNKAVLPLSSSHTGLNKQRFSVWQPLISIIQQASCYKLTELLQDCDSLWASSIINFHGDLQDLQSHEESASGWELRVEAMPCQWLRERETENVLLKNDTSTAIFKSRKIFTSWMVWICCTRCCDIWTFAAEVQDSMFFKSSTNWVLMFIYKTSMKWTVFSLTFIIKEKTSCEECTVCVIMRWHGDRM